MDDTARLQHVQQLIARHCNSPPYIYAHLFPRMTVKMVEVGRVIVLLEVEPMHLNSKGSLHGSVTATIVDFMGGMAIAAKDGRDNTGVSVDIHVTYLAGAKVGETLEIEGVVNRLGLNMAYTTVTIRCKDKTCAIGSHTKFVRTDN